MKLKSLLLGSAAALVAVSGARAADAVVIPEPEAVEYVRVCDAAGAGYFYIPGSETCLKFSGYVQYEVGFGRGVDYWKKATEARLEISSWTDSEYGAVTTYMRLTSGRSYVMSDATQAALGLTDAQQAAINGNAANVFVLDRATLSIGGLSMGLMGSLWDYSATGAADTLIGNGNASNAIQYTANFGGGSFALQLQDDAGAGQGWVPDVVAKATFSAGDASFAAGVAYDESAKQWSAKVTAGYMGFGAVVQYTNNAGDGSQAYGGTNPWVLGANYGFDATEKLNLNVGAVYGFAGGWNPTANWAVGVEAAYKLTNTFTVSARARAMNNNNWDARVRFKASF